MSTDNKKSGFTPIPDGIIDALYSRRLSPLHFQIMLYVIRKTYGFQKNYDIIAISKMARDIGRHRTKVCGGVADLKQMGMLELGEPTKRGRMMRVLDPENWDQDINGTVTKSLHVTKTGHVTKSVTQLSRKRDTLLSRKRDTQETIYKDTIQETPPISPTEKTDKIDPREMYPESEGWEW